MAEDEETEPDKESRAPDAEECASEASSSVKNCKEYASEASILDATPVTAASAKANLIVSLQLPALKVHELLEFEVRVAHEKDEVLEHVSDIINETVREMRLQLREQLSFVDSDGSDRKLERMRAKAIAGLDKWKDHLKAADDGLIRVDLAKKQMNSMREAYYKELTMLREELHLAGQARKEGREFTPDDINIFDPAAYAFDDEVGVILKQKAAMLQQRFEEHKDRIRSRLDELNKKLESQNLLLVRKDMLLEGLMQEHGYKNEVSLEATLEKSRAAQAAAARSKDRKKSRGVTDTLRTAARMLHLGSSPKPQGVACSCGNLLMPDANFCRKCGAPRASGKAAESEKCRCGNILLPDAEFCRKCGTPRAEAIVAPESTPADTDREKEKEKEKASGWLWSSTVRRTDRRACTALNRSRSTGLAKLLHGKSFVSAEAEKPEAEKPEAGRAASSAEVQSQSDWGGQDVEEAMQLLFERRAEVEWRSLSEGGVEEQDIKRRAPREDRQESKHEEQREKQGREEEEAEEEEVKGRRRFADSGCQTIAASTRHALVQCDFEGDSAAPSFMHELSTQGTLNLVEDAEQALAEGRTLGSSLPGVERRASGGKQPSKVPAAAKQEHATLGVAQILQKHGVPAKSAPQRSKFLSSPPGGAELEVTGPDASTQAAEASSPQTATRSTPKGSFRRRSLQVVAATAALPKPVARSRAGSLCQDAPLELQSVNPLTAVVPPASAGARAGARNGSAGSQASASASQPTLELGIVGGAASGQTPRADARSGSGQTPRADARSGSNGPQAAAARRTSQQMSKTSSAPAAAGR